MNPSINDKVIAYLVLISGLAISAVAEYYSIMGLIAIYPAALIPIVIMGVVLGIGKISGTVWLKQNWEWAPFFLKAYVLPAIVVLMMITSLGVFGFLSKAHSDQSLVSGDVQSKISVYDTKIQTAKDNIDANRKALKQMDEAVDQVMGRSQDEKGADKAVAIRRGQQKERARLQSEITAEQKTISQLSEERAPIAAEVRKVEAEVGPIKYIAHLLYGENPDANILEKAVIWVTVLIVIVLDPLAVVLLLASQYSFQRFRELEEEANKEEELQQWSIDARERARQLDQEAELDVADVGEKPTADELAELDNEIKEIISETTSTSTTIDASSDIPMNQLHPYLNEPFVHFTNLTPMVSNPKKEPGEDLPVLEAEISIPPWFNPISLPVTAVVEEEPKILATGIDVVERPGDYITPPEEESMADLIEKYGYTSEGSKVVVNGVVYTKEEFDKRMAVKPLVTGYVQNEEQAESSQWNKVITEQEYRDKAEQNLKNESINNPNNAA